VVVTKRHHKRRWALVATLCAVVVAVTGLRAVADGTAPIDNIVPTGKYNHDCAKGSFDKSAPYGTVCLTDNSDVYYYVESRDNGLDLEARDNDVVVITLHDQYSPSHLAIHRDDTPTFSGSGETDIVYQEGGVPTNFAGYTICDDPIEGTRKCDQAYIRIEGAGVYSLGTVCHETGHAVGLTHGNMAGTTSQTFLNTDSRLACMINPAPVNAVLGSNNRTNIDAVYPAP
jgi:hypothetical protein